MKDSNFTKQARKFKGQFPPYLESIVSIVLYESLSMFSLDVFHGL